MRSLTRAVWLLGVVYLLVSTVTVTAFRFTIVPGTLKCFTHPVPEEGRYELRYRMANSLAPFVSVSVTSSTGRILLEHEVATPSAKELFNLPNAGTVAVCFNSAQKAAGATSLHVSLNIINAEDAELTRMKKQSYSTSSPISLGVGKGSAALRQMKYIDSMIKEIRMCMNTVIACDLQLVYALEVTRVWMWRLLYVFTLLACTIVLVNYYRLRRCLSNNGLIPRGRKKAL